MVADWSGSLLAWEEELGRLKERLGPVFSREDLGKRRARSSTGCCLGWSARRVG